jgi:hypothetical protein
MSSRPIHFRYSDPVDLIWLAAAERLGMRVERSSEVYASWDGKDTLQIGSQEHFDADDSLAQMIFHELCHSLVAGETRAQPDWGLSNTDTRDLIYEHACHRLQAALAARYGLRQFMAVTTEWRPYWDALPLDPLRSDTDPATPLAQRAYERSEREPLRSILHAALEATAQVAAAVRPFAEPGSLWGQTRARHSSGFLLGDTEGRACGQCAWSFTRGKQLLCRRSAPAGKPALVSETLPACEMWEPKLTADDCARCGACCREGFDVVQVQPKERFAKLHPELVSSSSLGWHVPRPEGRCGALAGNGAADAPYRCRHYDERPKACGDFPVAGDACLLARRRVGLSRP